MPAFKTMDPNVILEAIEGMEDVLSPLVHKEEAVFRNSVCPICKSTGHEAFVNPSNPFSPGVALPNKLLRCIGCRSEWDPYTQLITRHPVTGATD